MQNWKKPERKFLIPQRVCCWLLQALFLGIVVFIFLDGIAAGIQYGGHKEYIAILAVVVAIDAFSSLPFAYLRYLNKARTILHHQDRKCTCKCRAQPGFHPCHTDAIYKGDYKSLWLYSTTDLIGFVFVANLIGYKCFFAAFTARTQELLGFRVDKKLLLAKMLNLRYAHPGDRDRRYDQRGLG